MTGLFVRIQNALADERGQWANGGGVVGVLVAIAVILAIIVMLVWLRPHIN